MVQQISLRQVNKAITVNWRFYLLIGLIAFAVLVSRQPDRLLNAQFWAEDGTIFYANAYNLGFLKSLLLPYAGYLSIGQRLIASFLQLFPLLWAPLISNLIALSVQILPVILIVSSRFAHLIPSLSIRALLAFLYLAVPNATEIHGSMANSQWYLALLACMVFVAKPSKELAWCAFDIGILLLSALSGPFSILLLPIALIYWRIRRDRWQIVLISGLAVGALAQGITILLNASTARHVASAGATLGLFAKILAGQVFLGALIGERGYGKLGALIGGPDSLAILVAAIGLLILLYALLKGPLELGAFITYGGLIFLAALVGRTVPWNLLALPGSATRYWFIPVLAFITSLVWIASQQRLRWLRFVGIMLLAIMAIGIVLDWQHPALVDLSYRKYANQFERAPAGTNLSIPINPPGWFMDLTKH